MGWRLNLGSASRCARGFDANASKSAFKSSHTKKIGQKQLKALAQRLRRAPFPPTMPNSGARFVRRL
jgi:hypothetical protein